MQMLMINVRKSVRAIFWYVPNATEASGTVHHQSQKSSVKITEPRLHVLLGPDRISFPGLACVLGC